MVTVFVESADVCPGGDDTHRYGRRRYVADFCDPVPGGRRRMTTRTATGSATPLDHLPWIRQPGLDCGQRRRTATPADICPGFDDLIDDADRRRRTPDGCDPCPADDANDDSDGDGVCDSLRSLPWIRQPGRRGR